MLLFGDLFNLKNGIKVHAIGLDILNANKSTRTLCIFLTTLNQEVLVTKSEFATQVHIRKK